jgi:hypothetical protein
MAFLFCFSRDRKEEHSTVASPIPQELGLEFQGLHLVLFISLSASALHRKEMTNTRN